MVTRCSRRRSSTGRLPFFQVLLKCAMLGLIRYYAVVANGVGFDFVQNIMVISGTLTLFISAFFLIRQHNVKRMFAYHSVAHMGVIAFGLGVGGAIGLFAGTLSLCGTLFTKALAFCSTGNITAAPMAPKI